MWTEKSNSAEGRNFLFCGYLSCIIQLYRVKSFDSGDGTVTGLLPLNYLMAVLLGHKVCFGCNRSFVHVSVTAHDPC